MGTDPTPHTSAAIERRAQDIGARIPIGELPSAQLQSKLALHQQLKFEVEVPQRFQAPEISRPQITISKDGAIASTFLLPVKSAGEEFVETFSAVLRQQYPALSFRKDSGTHELSGALDAEIEVNGMKYVQEFGELRVNPEAQTVLLAFSTQAADKIAPAEIEADLGRVLSVAKAVIVTDYVMDNRLPRSGEGVRLVETGRVLGGEFDELVAQVATMSGMRHQILFSDEAYSGRAEITNRKVLHDFGLRGMSGRADSSQSPADQLEARKAGIMLPERLRASVDGWLAYLRSSAPEAGPTRRGKSNDTDYAPMLIDGDEETLSAVRDYLAKAYPAVQCPNVSGEMNLQASVFAMLSGASSAPAAASPAFTKVPTAYLRTIDLTGETPAPEPVAGFIFRAETDGLSKSDIARIVPHLISAKFGRAEASDVSPSFNTAALGEALQGLAVSDLKLLVDSLFTLRAAQRLEIARRISEFTVESDDPKVELTPITAGDFIRYAHELPPLRAKLREPLL